MKIVVFLLACSILVCSVYSVDMSDEEYLDPDYDYSGPVDKRTRKSVVEQLSSLLKNMKTGEFKVDKRNKQGILSYLYDMARKEKRVAGGIPRLSTYQYLRALEEAAGRENRINDLSSGYEKRDRMRGGAWNSGK
ncbi:uncharacterized protein LOC111698793 [Eurytemora carolleeae]|uniref:uncharacterized protein LOC111698793 n=1 Tax=Eurytemora carolleeae TaxID=1294199 RepID=UPI000C760B4C|nr:uncharacterized protein LOC111698793 [Eurytemora carolleeae]|eukprot:XP_023325001.1 uncharacterized protein LOC111698793 [Eurytemora affinis]